MEAPDRTSDFDDLLDEIADEAVREGSAAIVELATFDAQFALAAEILHARLSADVTQSQLAELSGIQQSEISKIERGAIAPRVTTIDRLLAPLGRRLGVIERSPVSR